MFKKVLVANRGEIAVRIIRTLREMGIQSVAVYSTADKDSLHVKLADEAVAIGGPKTQDSYLDMNNILSAALLTGADAIHPGYGFLSENEMFAEMVTAVGIKWIGPSSDVIALMGNKAQAREAMRKAGVPVIPGSEGFVRNVAEVEAIADEVGYPILLKAAAGGGGKGMRFVYHQDELASQFNDAQNEAQAAFGDDQLYVEKVMTNVRHIEMQIMRDQAGHMVYFPERNCSLQRKNQKLIEETPAVGVSQAQRDELGAIAKKAVDAIDYENTGTIEFLEDTDGHFYFMEMNTRIQVEHPVTEMLVNLDLIRLQILVAAGEDLPVQQSDIKMNGHVIEARINAEVPEKGFLPSTGTITNLYWPNGGLGSRIDTGIYNHDKIQPFYDAMIGKVIAQDHTRDLAVRKLRRMLSEIEIDGIETNRNFQLDLLSDEHFNSGDFNTTYIEDYFLPAWQKQLEEASDGSGTSI
ncbi:acetyl-CoA carboxylase biotin carboxylase subunit [Weissella uvarum]|uniref:acetyl-CoA carboxylase biotin carboxylase subunit n=1 Tax=Weissella uvarum TaxID=1479233 RepID=UPI00195F2656|nr:acetyl-CoA carboxylase biotin carboxylase subunit [Weissella uvarum]MBM7617723.1 acetyl-CoA carboxylase biotin carboxylase subunit [Weissella uvarum]MCM0595898.1 acetyl-CoA carboxylase biotin carboxylase subunit [Weissella uvarum]